MKKLVIAMMVLALALMTVPVMAGVVGSPKDVPVVITVASWCALTVESGTLELTIDGIGSVTSNALGVGVAANADGHIDLSGDSATGPGGATIDFATLLGGLPAVGATFGLGNASWALSITADETSGGAFVAPGTYSGAVTVTASMP